MQTKMRMISSGPSSPAKSRQAKRPSSTSLSVMAEGSKFDAPAVHDDKAIREEKKKCVTCGIEVDFHLGPTGPGRCFGIRTLGRGTKGRATFWSLPKGRSVVSEVRATFWSLPKGCQIVSEPVRVRV